MVYLESAHPRHYLWILLHYHITAFLLGTKIRHTDISYFWSFVKQRQNCRLVKKLAFANYTFLEIPTVSFEIYAGISITYIPGYPSPLPELQEEKPFSD